MTDKKQDSNYHNGLRHEMKEFLPDCPVNVLEIGCGDGAFVECVPEHSEYWGVEPKAESAKVAEGRLTRVHAALYDDIADQLPDTYFDLVICNDVIEHMPDHEEFLRNIQRKMTPGGHLVGSIPNVRYYENLRHLILERDWKYREQGILDRTHLRFFTGKSLLSCLRDCGFEVEIFKGINGIKKRYMPPQRIFKQCMFSLLGDDMRYVQFGFRVTRK